MKSLQNGKFNQINYIVDFISFLLARHKKYTTISDIMYINITLHNRVLFNDYH